jgi:hypothetical protein
MDETTQSMTIAELKKITPAINWRAYFDGLGYMKVNEVIVSQPKYMIALQTIFGKTMSMHGKNI